MWESQEINFYLECLIHPSVIEYYNGLVYKRGRDKTGLKCPKLNAEH